VLGIQVPARPDQPQRFKLPVVLKTDGVEEEDHGFTVETGPFGELYAPMVNAEIE